MRPAVCVRAHARARECERVVCWSLNTRIGLVAAKQQGLTRAIGVSNYKTSDLNAVLSLGMGTPSVNQCSMSVGNHDDVTIAFCKSKNIV